MRRLHVPDVQLPDAAKQQQQQEAGAVSKVMLAVAYLRSYENMGTFELTCVEGCSCEPLILDGHHEPKNSQTHMEMHQVTPAGGQQWRPGGAACNGTLFAVAGWQRQGVGAGQVQVQAGSVGAVCCWRDVVAETAQGHCSADLSCPAFFVAFFPLSAADECHLKMTVLPKTNSGKHKVKISGLIVGEVSGWLLYDAQVGAPANPRLQSCCCCFRRRRPGAGAIANPRALSA